ncbi:MAG: response regulator, partial [Anaerolineae bacterium]|nr:response regulator [Anaerolineae bacterium]
NILKQPELDLCQKLLGIYGSQLQVRKRKENISLSCLIPSIKPPTVLIVEDYEDARLLYRRYLQGANYVLRFAASGEELWEELAKERPAVILLDVLMPREDGWMILQRLKILPETAEIPVIICSVLDQPSLAFALGAQEVLHKPIEEKELREAIRKALNQ